jgi:RimJ/RimL family protein N-acetyltransferase
MHVRIVLETERLLIRHMCEDDAEALLAMESDPDVLRYVGRKPLTDVDAYRTRIRTTFLPYDEKPGGFGVWAVVEKVCGEFIGVSSLRPALDSTIASAMAYGPGEAELGYALGKPSWGRGYASEMAQALVRKAFTEMGVELLVASVTVANVASIRVLEKAGLHRTEHCVLLPNEDEPSAKFTLTRNQFRQQQGPSASQLPFHDMGRSPAFMTS